MTAIVSLPVFAELGIAFGICFGFLFYLARKEISRPPTAQEKRLERLVQERERELEDIWRGFDRTREKWGFEASHTCEKSPEKTVRWEGRK